MKTFLLLLLSLPLFAICQSQKQTPPVDSVEYYQKEIGRLWHTTYDSLQQSRQYLELRNNITRLEQKSKDYSGAVLFTDIVHSDYDHFNTVLADSGFSALKPLAVRFGLGVSHKRGNAMYDIYFATIGTDNQSKKGKETIATNYSNFLQINLGIDFIDAERVSLYPYGGFSIHSSVLKYRKSDDINPNYNFLSDIHTDNNKTWLSSTRIAYQYGIGFDYAFDYNKDRTYKTIAFVKFGVDRPFKTDVYKYNDIPDYKPEIKQGNWIISVGFKFANKR